MRNVIVTGGSRGLGLGIARRLVETGFRVIAVARKENDELALAMQEAERANPGSFHFASFDLAQIECLAESGDDVAKRPWPDLWAGEQRWRQCRRRIGAHAQLADRAGGAFEHAVANRADQIRGTLHDGRWRRPHRQHRLNQRLRRLQRISVYGATKASLIGFTRSLAREIGRMGVNVNAVAPGFVDTDMTQGLTDEHRQQIIRRSALKRLVDIDDVANSVEFLLSDKAKSITGTVLTVDAGNTA